MGNNGNKNKIALKIGVEVKKKILPVLDMVQRFGFDTERGR